RSDLEYRSGDRTGMQKIKNYRSADRLPVQRGQTRGRLAVASRAADGARFFDTSATSKIWRSDAAPANGDSRTTGAAVVRLGSPYPFVWDRVVCRPSNSF